MNECLSCRYRGTVPNSRHSSCKHPAVDRLMGDHEDLIRLMEGIVNDNRIPWFYPDLHVEFEGEAIGEGWACWPFNFDPVWLKECTGFKGVG